MKVTITYLVLFSVIAVFTIATCKYASATPDPLLTGKVPITREHLPADLQQLDEDELQERLTAMENDLFSASGEPWWQVNIDEAELTRLRYLSAYLGETQLESRCLILLADDHRFDNAFFQTNLAMLDKAAELASKDGLQEELAHCHKVLGRCLSSAGLFESAIDSYLMADGLFAELGQPDRQAYVLCQTAILYGSRLGDAGNAIKYYEQLEALTGLSGDGSQSSRMMLHGFQLMDYGRYIDAVQVFERATEQSRTDSSDRTYLRHLTQLGKLQLILNRNAEGEASLITAMELCSQQADFNDPFEPHLYYAEYLYQSGRIESAIEFMENSLLAVAEMEAGIDVEKRNAEGRRDELRSAKVLINAQLGRFHYLIRDPQIALEFYLSADALNEDKSFVFPRERIEGNLAMVYIDLGRYEEALDQLDEMAGYAVPGFTPDNDQPDPLESMLFGSAYLGLGDLETAAQYLDEAESACSDEQSPYDLVLRAQLAMNLAKLSEQQGNPGEAIDRYFESLELYSEAARTFVWDTELKRDLPRQIRRTAGPLIALLMESNDTEAIQKVDRIIAAFDAARDLAWEPIPDNPTPGQQALIDYRTTLTNLVAQRIFKHWAFITNQRGDSPATVYMQSRGFTWSQRREITRQYSTLEHDTDARISALEKKVEEQLSELRRLDPETAAIIELEINQT